jgi:hypothetical protein
MTQFSIFSAADGAPTSFLSLEESQKMGADAAAHMRLHEKGGLRRLMMARLMRRKKDDPEYVWGEHDAEAEAEELPQETILQE